MEKEAQAEFLRSIQEGLPGMLREALEKERKEITTSLMREVDEKVVAPLKAELAGLKSATEAAGKASTESKIRAQVEQLSKDGKIFPAEIDGEVEMLVRADATVVEARLKLIGDRPAMSFAATEDEGNKGDAAQRSADMKLLEGKLINPRIGYDRKELELVRDLMAEAGGDHKKFRELAFAREAN